MHYYTLNIGDYLKDTGGLSLIEHGAYMLLLNWAYANEKPLPLDEERLFRIASAVTKHDQTAVRGVLGQFFQREDDGFHHKRVISEIQKFYRRSEAGTKNIGKRYETPTKSLPTEQEADTKQADNHNTRITRNAKTKNHLLSADADEPELTLESPADPPPEPPAGLDAKKKKGGRERDAVFDALLRVCGMPMEGLTGSEGGRVAKARKEIRDAMPQDRPDGEMQDVIVAEIERRAAAYRREWPSAELTPTALAANWSRFAGGQKKEGGAVGGPVDAGAPARYAEAYAEIWGGEPQPWPVLSVGDQAEVRRWIELNS